MESDGGKKVEEEEGSITLAEIPNLCSHGKFKMNGEERKAAA